MSQVAACRDKRQVIPIPYAPGGCPVKLGEEKCGETQGLDIIKDFHQLYQEKMSQIDVSAGGDSLQEKVDLQQKWIDDLTEQNRMLARVIAELETEAIGRLQQLENKLQNAAKSFSEEDVEALAERDRKIKELEEALNSHTSIENDVENDSDRKSRENATQGIGSDKQREETKFESKDSDYSGGRKDEDQIKQEIRKIREQSSKDMPPGDEEFYEDGRQKQGATEGSTGTDRGKAEDSSDEKRKSGGQSKYSSDDKKKNDENYAMKQDVILSSPSFTTQDDDTSDLPLCPVRKVRPCSPETCRKASIKLKEIATSNMNENYPDSPNQEEFTSTYSEKETKEKATPTICPVKKVPCTSETCKKNSRKSPEPTAGVRTNSIVISVSSAGKQDASRSKLAENLEKKSVHLLIENNKENMIVEPEKDHDQGSLDISKPRIESVPVIGVQDSLEILKGTVKTQSSERSLLNEETQNSECICETKNYVDEFMKLKEENKMFREGEEIRRLKNELDEKMKRILELNEENRTLNEMVNALKCNQALIMRYSEEIDHLKKSLKWTSKEKEEYEFLKQKVKLLEQGKGDTDNITSNLQTAVDLYVDTIQLLQNSEQKLKSEVEQYRVKNDVMGDSLVYMGQEIDDLNQKFHEDLEEQIWLNFLLHIENTDIHHTNAIREQQVANAQKLQLQLMDLNYHLEMEHVNTLQDLSMLETQLYKYQSFFKLQEEDRSVMKVQLKKLSKKNKCYEEIVQFFKEEMSVMSDELLTLQEVLNVTNVSSQEENTKLINAILQLRRINDRLVSHLCEIEKQVVLENQINQINEARINELQNIIGSKNNDLNQHDQTIQEMRKKLNNATKQNADLKKTIKNLTDAVVEIQEGIKSVERDHNRNKNDASVVESNVCLASGNLKDIKCCIENKNDKIIELENKLKSQEVSIILATKELDVLKEKKADYKKLVVSLKEQLASYDKKNEEMMGDFQLVSTQLQDYVNLDHMKNYEIGHYKSLVEEMKMSLMQLNQGLEKFEASNIHFYEDMSNAEICCDKNGTSSRVFSELKKSMADMKRRLSDAEFKGGLIEEELLKVKESHMSQIREEVTESQKELETRILASIEEQANLNMLVEQQKEEIEHLKKELLREKLESSNYKQNLSKLQNENMTSNAQMEILHLKCELNKSLQRQRVLSEENDKIHSKMISLRKKLSTIEEAYEMMKQENEENKMQLKKTLREKEYIAHKNQELTKNIEDMRSSHDQLERQCRYNSDCMQNLQLELSETQTEKDNISSEAQNLAEVVKMWLKEQNVVNGEIRGKFQNYSNIICSLRESMMKRMSQEKSWVKKPMQQPFSPRHYTPTPQSERRSSSPSRNRGQERNTCDVRYRSMSPWRNYDGYNRIDLIDEDAVSRKSHQMRNISYDSNPSAFSSRSPSPRSDFLQEEVNNLNLNDWFSPNFKETDTDADEGDDEMFINKLHVLTAQVQEANKRWQQKMNTNSLPTSRGKRSN